ncbi:hypothetical protein DdX_17513 [Ditylenchus destructor]|uniref:SprT-like domain-containing protein n=1 Tax=Ditylenchus destructor TaxID=166010 RepID=A0AAD4MMW1_9BILA|nr:hypothetical protein DdX_17513 [Ditylenchus destructor]
MCEKCERPSSKDFCHYVHIDSELLRKVTKKVTRNEPFSPRDLVSMAVQLGPKNYRKIYDELVVKTNVCQENPHYIEMCLNIDLILDVAYEHKNCWGMASVQEGAIYINPMCLRRPLYLITTMLHEIKHIVAAIQFLDYHAEEWRYRRYGTKPPDAWANEMIEFDVDDPHHSGFWPRGIKELEEEHGIFVTPRGVVILDGYERQRLSWKLQAKHFLREVGCKATLERLPKGTAIDIILKVLALLARSCPLKQLEVAYRERKAKKRAALHKAATKYAGDFKDAFHRLGLS